MSSLPMSFFERLPELGLLHGQVLGAVGRVVRMERCERVQLITAAARLIVSSCHDCILYLGVNHAPLLIGDNRFIQARASLALACMTLWWLRIIVP